MKSKSNGFTLIELIFIVGFIAILVSLSIPTIAKFPVDINQSDNSESEDLYIPWMLNPANPIGVFQSQP